MNLQEKVTAATAELRSRAAVLAEEALKIARARAGVTVKRVEALKGSLATLSVATREFNKVARLHAARFAKENSTLAAAARKDVSALARSTYSTLTKRPVAKKTRKAAVKTKRARAKGA